MSTPGNDRHIADVCTVALRFDGTNEDDVAQWYRAAYGTWCTPSAANHFPGVLSEAENQTIAAGLDEVVMDHLVDVVDDGAETRLILRACAPVRRSRSNPAAGS